MFSQELKDDVKALLLKHGIDWSKNIDLAKDIKQLIVKYNSTEGNIRVLKDQLFTSKNMEDGTICAVCNQNVKMYLKSIDAEMGKCLITLFILDFEKPTREWWHVGTEIKVPFKVSGSFAKMRYWGLIEQRPKKAGEKSSKRTTGMWRITQQGRDFVSLNITLQKYVKLYNGVSYGLEEGEDKKSLSMMDVLGNRFDYNELMGR